jgi:hypothetical protein
MNDPDLARLLPDPAHDLPADRHHILREQLMSEIDQSDCEGTVTIPAPRRRRRVLIPALAGGLLTILVAGWLTSAFVFGVGRFWAGRTDAGQLLGRIALVASASTDIPPLDEIRDDQFVFIETYGGFSCWCGPNGWVPFEPGTRQVWQSVSLSRPGLLHRERDGESPDDVVIDPTSASLHYPSLRYLATLPTNPDLLLLKIYWENGSAGPNPQAEAFTTIGDLMRESVVPPDVAAALYQAAARIPGVEVVDDAVDALGRHGIAVARTHGGIREEWIFDRGSLQFLGERSVVVGEVEGPTPAGSSRSTASTRVGMVIGSTAVVARAIVDEAGKLPA